MAPRVLIVALVVCSACSDQEPDSEPTPPVAVLVEQRDAAAPASTTEPFRPVQIARDWWQAGATKACLDGAILRGAGPPAGTAIWCESAAGVKHGAFASWHPGGKASASSRKLEKLGPYRDGLEHGTWFVFWANGRKKLSISYKQGQRHGQYREFREHGRKKLDGWYQEGIANGTFSSYDPQGHLIANTLVKDGDGPMRRYHSNRTMALAYELRGGKVHGLWTAWDQNGTKLREVTYADGVRQGPTTRWGPTGLVIERGSYLDDMKNGDWTAYERGKAVGRTRYRRGQVVQQ